MSTAHLSAAATPLVGSYAAAPALLAEDGSEERWAAWRAKGAAHDRAVRRKLVRVVPIVIGLIAAAIFMLVGR